MVRSIHPSIHDPSIAWITFISRSKAHPYEQCNTERNKHRTLLKDRETGKDRRTIQPAQLPQRNSAAATHVCLGWLTNRKMHRTPQNRRCCTTRLSQIAPIALAIRKPLTYMADEVFLTLYTHITSFKVISLCVIRKPFIHTQGHTSHDICEMTLH